MTLTIKINMSNAAFSDDPAETKRILAQAGGWIESEADALEPGDCKRLYDSNGNHVGVAMISR